MGKFILAASALLAATSAPALAATVNFEGAPGSFTSYSDQGATFTASGATILGTNTPNGTRGLLSNDSPRSELRADLSSLASFVSVDLGDFNADEDTIFLEIFNSANTSLGFTSLFLSATDRSMHTLSLSAANISYAIFGARAPAANGSSVYADNFTFRGAAPAVPEPATWALLLTGFGVIGGALRRRAKATVAAMA